MIASHLWFEYQQESNHITRQRGDAFLGPAWSLERRSQRSIGGNTEVGSSMHWARIKDIIVNFCD